jgi:hypothetical protein
MDDCGYRQEILVLGNTVDGIVIADGLVLGCGKLLVLSFDRICSIRRISCGAGISRGSWSQVRNHHSIFARCWLAAEHVLDPAAFTVGVEA